MKKPSKSIKKPAKKEPTYKESKPETSIMKSTVKWVNAALASSNLSMAMTHYRIANKEIVATDGNITAGHPWSFGGEFLVPGKEFEKILDRMTGEPEIVAGKDGDVKIKSGKFSGTIQTLPLNDWTYPGIDKVEWLPLPKDFLSIIGALRPFISKNATQQWSQSIAIENKWMFATNNVAVAGAKCSELNAKSSALLPVWAVEFIIGRQEELTHWILTDNYVAFKWKNGAWMKSQLIVGKFPEKAASMVQEAAKENPTQKIDDKFRDAFRRVAELAEDTLTIYPNRISSKFGKAVIEENISCEVPKGEKSSIWGAQFLLPALLIADVWAPSSWPKPAAFKGKIVCGYVTGRTKG